METRRRNLMTEYQAVKEVRAKEKNPAKRVTLKKSMKHIEKSIDLLNDQIKELEGVNGEDSDVSSDSGYDSSLLSEA
jgi:hypothetical protein